MLVPFTPSSVPCTFRPIVPICQELPGKNQGHDAVAPDETGDSIDRVISRLAARLNDMGHATSFFRFYSKWKAYAAQVLVEPVRGLSHSLELMDLDVSEPVIESLDENDPNTNRPVTRLDVHYDHRYIATAEAERQLMNLIQDGLKHVPDNRRVSSINFICTTLQDLPLPS